MKVKESVFIKLWNKTRENFSDGEAEEFFHALAQKMNVDGNDLIKIWVKHKQIIYVTLCNIMLHKSSFYRNVKMKLENGQLYGKVLLVLKKAGAF